MTDCIIALFESFNYLENQGFTIWVIWWRSLGVLFSVHIVVCQVHLLLVLSSNFLSLVRIVAKNHERIYFLAFWVFCSWEEVCLHLGLCPPPGNMCIFLYISCRISCLICFKWRTIFILFSMSWCSILQVFWFYPMYISSFILSTLWYSLFIPLCLFFSLFLSLFMLKQSPHSLHDTHFCHTLCQNIA